MRDYYEELWQRLPSELEPPDLELRLRLMRSEVQPSDHALDLGCGDGQLTGELARLAAHTVGADVAQGALDRARRRHPELEFALVPFDGELPFDEHTFDLVWASEVIEHVADSGRWLSEVRRVLTSQGRLLLTTPSHGRLRVLVGGIEAYSPPLGDHLHLYTARSLRTLLHDFGFEPVAVTSAGGAPLLRRVLLARAQR